MVTDDPMDLDFHEEALPQRTQSDGWQEERTAEWPEERSDDATQTELLTTISHKEERKLAAREEGRESVWFGLGMFGMIGWSVAVPVVASIALGLLIDRQWPSRFSWTLMLLFLGVVLGCINAWHWINRERSQIK